MSHSSDSSHRNVINARLARQQRHLKLRNRRRKPREQGDIPMPLSDHEHVVGIEETNNSQVEMVMVEQPSTTVPPADNSESLETEDLPKNYLKFRSQC
ncbi:hypothetical protein F2Q68_00031435 [Brassica cretica]|uniref:Uncharacterized protein n=2 Tax=Brassica cretica TaxID=69181 RepID=A0A8S9GHN5_BRACR|nr:hypothetical protein F2Q68_00031435 [Brassica cretica]KAF3532784.1 hypothetical protein DY000_02041066 [Brassica cretica]